MHNNNLLLPELTYSANLQVINGIEFSPREVDIISCFVRGVTNSKRIAEFLSRGKGKTLGDDGIEAHIASIKKKIRSNTNGNGKSSLDGINRAAISYFFTQSDKYQLLDRHYFALLVEKEFNNALIGLTKYLPITTKEQLIIFKRSEAAVITRHNNTSDIDFIPSFLNKHLKIFISNVVTKLVKSLDHFCPSLVQFNEMDNTSTKQTPNHVHNIDADIVCVVQSVASYQDIDDLKMQDIKDVVNNVILFIRDNSNAVTTSTMVDIVEASTSHPGSKYINILDAENYYALFFETLKALFPNSQSKIDDTEQRFKERCNDIADSVSNINGNTTTALNLVDNSILNTSSKYTNKIILQILRRPLQNWWIIVAIAGIIGLSIVLHKSINDSHHKEFIVHSELKIPVESALLFRSSLIRELDDKFKNGNSGSITTVAIVGIGGSGKTTLAHLYARTQQQKSEIIGEINSETDASLKESFENLAYKLADADKDNNQVFTKIMAIENPKVREEQIIGFVQKALLSHPNWLLIYDNVVNLTDIQKYVPQDGDTWGSGHVIITTQDAHIENNKHVDHVIQIGELSDDQKLKLFSRIVGNKKFPAEQIQEFLNHIPPFPLDVSVAAYYLKTTGTSFEKYLENLNSDDASFEATQTSVLKEAGYYTKTRYSIITLSLKNLIQTHNDFGTLLLFFILMDSQNIPKDLLEEYKNNAVVDRFVHELKKYSLITESSSSILGSIFSVHRTTQAIALAYLSQNLDLEYNKNLVAPVVEALECYVSDAIDAADLAKMRLLLAHVEALSRYKHLLNASATNAINTMLGCIYYCTGDGVNSKKILEECLVNLKRSSENNSPKQARVLMYLGIAQRRLGEYREAQRLLEQSVAIYNNHPKYLINKAQALAYLGNVHKMLDNNEVSRKFLEQSLEIFKNQHSALDTARTLCYLGTTYINLGKYKEANDLLVASISLYKKQLNYEYQDAFYWAMVYLGLAQSERGDYIKAKTIMEECLEIYNKHYPSGHPDIGWVLIHLGIIYDELGYYTQARDTLLRAIEIDKKYYNTPHSEIIWAMYHLGVVYIKLGENEAAQDRLRKVVEMYNKDLASIDCTVGWVLGDIGTAYKYLENYTLAKSLMHKSHGIYTQNYATNHPKIAQALTGLGEIYFLEGNFKVAENFFLQACKIFKQNSTIVDIYKTLELLGDLYTKKSLIAMEYNTAQAELLQRRAEDYFNQSLKIINSNFPHDSSHRVRLQFKLQGRKSRQVIH